MPRSQFEDPRACARNLAMRRGGGEGVLAHLSAGVTRLGALLVELGVLGFEGVLLGVELFCLLVQRAHELLPLAAVPPAELVPCRFGLGLPLTLAVLQALLGHLEPHLQLHLLNAQRLDLAPQLLLVGGPQ